MASTSRFLVHGKSRQCLSCVVDRCTVGDGDEGKACDNVTVNILKMTNDLYDANNVLLLSSMCNSFCDFDIYPVCMAFQFNIFLFYSHFRTLCLCSLCADIMLTNKQRNGHNCTQYGP